MIWEPDVEADFSVFGDVKFKDVGGDLTKVGLNFNLNTADRVELAKLQLRCHKVKAALTNMLDVVSSNYDLLATTLGIVLEREETDKFALRGESGVAATFKLSIDVYASVNKDNELLAHEWLSNHNLGSIVKETVNARTLSSAIKELLSSGAELPPEDLIKTFSKVTAKITKTY
ncbi:MAG: hypothetical protein WC998_00835 [Candidatus Paceibacterota bacterium]|jgi:hypothetical protein